MKKVFKVKTLKKSMGKMLYHQQYITLPNTSISIYKNKNNKIALVKQYRPIIDSFTFEIPGGGINNGETPKKAAIRELYEETGLIAETIEPLISCILSIGSSDEYVHIYKVLKVTNDNKMESHELDITPIWIDYKECLEMIKQGKIIDAKTIIAIQNV